MAGVLAVAELLDVRANREGDALQRGSSPVICRSCRTDRPIARAAERRIVTLAVAEHRDEEQAVRAGSDLGCLAVELLEVGGAQPAGAAAVRERREPVDRLTGGVDPDLGDVAVGADRARVVGHRQVTGRLAHDRVEAGRAAGHLAHRSGRR